MTDSVHLVDVYSVVDAPAVLYELLKERSKEKDINISHRELPSEQEHMKFFLSQPYEHWYLISADDDWAGYVSVTKRNEVGIVLFRRWRGKGIAKRALGLFMANHKPLPAIASQRSGKWLANINPVNERSARLFRSLGFEQVQVTYGKESA